MSRFEIVNSNNSNLSCAHSCDESCTKNCKIGSHSQLWGVVLSELSEMGNQWSFGVALNESSLVTVVIPSDHIYLEKLKSISGEFIGEFGLIKFSKLNICIQVQL